MAHYAAATYRIKTSIGYLVRRAGNLMVSRIEAVFASHEITFVQWLVLMHIRDGASTASEICRDLCYDSGALTRVIDQLGERGFVERRRGTGDRRLVELFLTGQGREIVAALLPLVVDNLNAALAGFSPDEVATLTRLLGKLVDALPATPKTCEVSELEFLK